MRFAHSSLALCLFFVSAPILAGQLAGSSPPYSKRQLADCMLKRMSSDRTLSYNDAAKTCKDQLQGNKTDAALKDASPPKPVS